MASFKQQRNYYLVVQPNITHPSAQGSTQLLSTNLSDPSNIIIQPPFTIELDVNRGRLGSFNDATIRIYNLGVKTRNRMLKDFSDYDNSRLVTLQAGYGPTQNLPFIFAGTIFSCYSMRIGTEYITEIVAHSGGTSIGKLYTGTTNFTKGTATSVVVTALCQNLAEQIGMNVGHIGNFPNPIKSDFIPSKPITDEVFDLTGTAINFDNFTINVYTSNEVNSSLFASTPATATVIDSSMGLLETPVREQNNMLIPVLFQPNIQPGQYINLQSSTLETVQNPNSFQQSYNGIMLVQNVHHSGIISEVDSGDLKTELSVVLGQ